MKIINGWVDQALRLKSPNYNERPDNSDISLLVIHNISLPPKVYDNDYVELFFQNKLPVNEHVYFDQIAELKVSSHFYIKRTGQLIQFVSCEDRAWHAGESCFCGVENCNDYSIGIELQGTDDEPYTDKQYQTLNSLTSAITERYPQIDKNRITGHQDIAPNRKTDPGPAFDWCRYLGALHEEA